MNKTKIEWADYTWNPVTGCLHGCKYCYARGIAKRFCTNEFGTGDGLISECIMGCQNCSEMDGLEFVGVNTRWEHGSQPFPFGFLPTFYKKRLDEPAQLKKPANIFVVSMGDLFGEWVPAEWIQNVFEACRKAPQHQYLFLTKNYLRASEFRYEDNWWIGKTITGKQGEHRWEGDPWNISGIDRANQFLSIEPVHGAIEDLKYYLYSFKWIIIGAETGNRKGKVIPEREWITQIVERCDFEGVPVFMKDSLVPIVGEENMRREWPLGLRRGSP